MVNGRLYDAATMDEVGRHPEEEEAALLRDEAGRVRAGLCRHDPGVLPTLTRAPSSPRAGAASAVLAFLMWGLFPLYWKMLSAVPALEVVAHRTAWGLVAAAGLVTLRSRWTDARAVLSRPRTLLTLAVSAVLIAVNWLLYIWAVVHDHVTEASLGYYVNPLVNVLLGVVVLRESLSRAQWIAVALAAVGVSVLTLGHGRFPWIALALAVTFGLYGLVRKTVAADALTGLLWETALLAPFAVSLLLVLASRGTGVFGAAHPRASLLLVARRRRHRGPARAVRARRAVAAALDARPHPVPVAEPAVPAGRVPLPRALHRRPRRDVRLHLDGARHPHLGPAAAPAPRRGVRVGRSRSRV